MVMGTNERGGECVDLCGGETPTGSAPKGRVMYAGGGDCCPSPGFCRVGTFHEIETADKAGTSVF